MSEVNKNTKAIKLIKIVIASMLGIFTIIDVVLVILESKNYPSYSWLIRDNRTDLIWLTFLFGGLISKVFYNRKVRKQSAETKGFMVFSSMIMLLFVVGKSCIIPMGIEAEALVMFAGGTYAYGVWPQYVKEKATNNAPN